VRKLMRRTSAIPVRPRAIAPRFGNTMVTLHCVGGDVGDGRERA
jgi:hypothetical protein